MKIEELEEYIKKKHADQKRKQGTPYYLHPIAVKDLLKKKGFSEEYQIAALLHDLLEDTETTYEEIIEKTNFAIAEAVRLVSKEKGYQMQEYIDRIHKNDMARMVKLADRIHNLSEVQYGSISFKKKYIEETEKWFLTLAKDTVFEADLKAVLENLKKREK